jgi:recombination protein RecR
MAKRKADAPAAVARPASGGGYPESVERLIAEFAKLPGIGRRSAERLAFHILKTPAADAAALARAVDDVKKLVRHCRVCYNLTDWSPAGRALAAQQTPDADPGLCAVCAAASLPADATDAAGAHTRRDASVVMVVEQPKDLIALEQTGQYRGVYHVLMGRLSPLDGVGPGDLTVDDLLRRIDDPSRNAGAGPEGGGGAGGGGGGGGVAIAEVVLALNPTMEGDGTALYLAQELAARGVRVTRLARGLPVGSTLEFASKAVLADAIQGRQVVR